MVEDKITPSSIYQFIILLILIKSGGKSESSRVKDLIIRDYRFMLNEKDLMEYAGGNELRWQNYTRFARQHLKEKGFLENKSPRGIWEITDSGREECERLKNFLKESL